MSFVFARNVAERVVVVLLAAGPTSVDIVEIADPVTGTAISVLDTSLTPVVFPLTLTQTPGNPLSFYSIEMIIGTVGEFIIEFDPDVGSNFTDKLEVTTAGSVAAPSLQTCRLEDHIADPQGAPVENITVSARILAPPAVFSGAAISTELVETVTDSNGFFSLEVLRSATVDVIIPFTGYRRTIVVPNAASAALFSIAAS